MTCSKSRPSPGLNFHTRSAFTILAARFASFAPQRHRKSMNRFSPNPSIYVVLKVEAFPWAEFPHKVGLHNSCSTLRKLRTAKASEIDEPFFSKPLDLLSKVRGIEFVTPSRPDECCGFGGTFSIFEEPVSAKMGYDKVADHHAAGAEYIVSADMSCLMHQKGCAVRLGLDIRFIHIAQILNGDRA